MYCPGCGYPLDENTVTCGVCGTDVLREQPAAPADAASSVSPRQTWMLAPPSKPVRPRVWVLAFGLLLSLTFLGLLIGIPLIMSELRVRSSGLPAQNLGWCVAGLVYGLFFSLFLLVAWLMPRGYLDRPSHGPSHVYCAGERVIMKDHTLTVTAVDTNFQSGYEFEKPSYLDEVYVLVGISITNDSDRRISINSMGFRLDDGTDSANEVVTLSGMSDRLRQGYLAPHESTTGNIAFVAKRKSSKLILHYRGNLFSGSPISIDLLHRLR
ncbi:MAG TPA: DUF4352 domain-containing protein [Armatimonadota bacterium]